MTEVRAERGFSLVEVVLAIGVISFALLAILGILTLAFRTDRSATDDTLLPVMTRKVVEYIRATSAPSNASDFRFDANGELQTDANGSLLTTDTAETLYRCEVTSTPETAISAGRMVVLRLDYFWPAAAASSGADPNATIHASYTED